MRTSRQGGSENLNISNERMRTLCRGVENVFFIPDEYMRTSRLGGSENFTIPSERMRKLILGVIEIFSPDER